MIYIFLKLFLHHYDWNSSVNLIKTCTNESPSIIKSYLQVWIACHFNVSIENIANESIKRFYKTAPPLRNFDGCSCKATGPWLQLAWYGVKVKFKMEWIIPSTHLSALIPKSIRGVKLRKHQSLPNCFFWWSI